MAHIQLGTTAVHWGIQRDGAATLTVSGTLVGTNEPQSVELSREGDDRRFRGEDGDTITRIFFDNLDRLEIEVGPTGATKAAALAAFSLPTRGSLVSIIADGADTQAGGISGTGTGDSTGAWIFISGRKRLTVDSEARITMSLERHAKHLSLLS